MITLGNGQIALGDCLDVMRSVPSGSVDMILCDLPYGTTACSWDSVISLADLWSEYWRIAKWNAAVVLTAQTPFDKVLGISQIQHLKYEWIWEKTAATGFLNAKKSPLKAHENILVFYKNPPVYNPEMTEGHPIKRVNPSYADHGQVYGKAKSVRAPYHSTHRYPRSVIKFAKDNRIGKPHPTQKPVALFEYLIKTYTNPGDVVMDNCIGSGTTAIAAENAGRRWIGIERDPGYFGAACERIARLVYSDQIRASSP